MRKLERLRQLLKAELHHLVAFRPSDRLWPLHVRGHFHHTADDPARRSRDARLGIADRDHAGPLHRHGARLRGRTGRRRLSAQRGVSRQGRARAAPARAAALARLAGCRTPWTKLRSPGALPSTERGSERGEAPPDARCPCRRLFRLETLPVPSAKQAVRAGSPVAGQGNGQGLMTGRASVGGQHGRLLCRMQRVASA
mgnify:CR=1 FL=1